MSKMIDMTGWKMCEHDVPDSRVTVVKRVENDQKGRAQWLCRCDCGNEFIARGAHLRSGNTLSCGCLQKEITAKTNPKKAKAKDLAGQKFGRLTALYPTNERRNGHVAWHCLCDCGHECDIASDVLLRGHAKSCGCLVSWGEAQCIKWLKEKNIRFKAQYEFVDLISKKGYPLKFDFAILDGDDLQCLIEYQGEQHYKDVGEFGRQQRNETDKLKENYCKEHNISLFEIRYDEDIDLALSKINAIVNSEF